MNGSNEENFKEPLGDWLKESFDQFELSPRPSLRKRVFAGLPNNGKRLFQAALGLLLALLLALYFVKADKNEIAVATSHGKATASQHSAPIKKMGMSSTKKATNDEAMPVRASAPAVKVVTVFPIRQVRTATSKAEMVKKQKQQLKAETESESETATAGLQATFPQTLLASLPTNPPKPLETSLPVWPEIVPDSNTLAPVQKKNATGWFFSVTPSQNFQMLYVRSNAEMVIENIRFAGLSSMQSKGIKLAAGVERWGFKGSAAYTFLQYQTRFDIGGPKIEMEQTGPDQYKIIRQNTSTNEIRQDLHFIGLGIARQFDFHARSLGPYIATTGLEYTRSLSNDQGLAMVNASFARKLHLRAPFQISVGPTVEVGLNDLKIKSMGWRYRPYQVGISVTVSGVVKHK
ncbi:hypothetical protein MUK70_04215 [Dyadobacter chenwenxiniae]|uniref:Outer membrane protein beta-barrel domain-containing protein n=1 Tax=Dyadobacter chenwenxiniae TaxID=2906456 RepID=A0A9X1THR4_9BACT|nr:hypothetical protein [Dyadobacter chenwenxiniae]MCF0064749.1 hypothetical protein [Dyadobacter chenwenxiniae]UON84197.1 hypothetical protein MUK70_04215 [Dyadobacter chenwenxiniae]